MLWSVPLELPAFFIAVASLSVGAVYLIDARSGQRWKDIVPMLWSLDWSLITGQRHTRWACHTWLPVWAGQARRLGLQSLWYIRCHALAPGTLVSANIIASLELLRCTSVDLVRRWHKFLCFLSQKKVMFPSVAWKHHLIADWRTGCRIRTLVNTTYWHILMPPECVYVQSWTLLLTCRIRALHGQG